MGTTRSTPSDWTKYSSTIKDKKVEEIYRTRHLQEDLDPKNITVRESRDSDANPESNAIIVAQDITGSMDPVLDSMIKNSLKTLFTEIYDRKPVSDPHIMLMGIGDVEWDTAPAQMTQFESSIVLADQLSRIYVERGGGGNYYESYTLAWYLAATKTSIDCFEKRGKKGYIFTVGDERITPTLRAAHIEHFIGVKPQSDLQADALLMMVSQMYHVFHIMIAQGNHMQYDREEVIASWTKFLGQRAMVCEDHTKIGEIITSAIEITEGRDKDSVISSWTDKSTALVVQSAISGLTPTGGDNGVMIL